MHFESVSHGIRLKKIAHHAFINSNESLTYRCIYCQDDIPLTRLEYNDQLHQDPGLHHGFQPGYDLPAYRAEPPEYEGHGHVDSVQGYGAPSAHLNRYNGSLEESYGSQTMHPQVNPVSLGSYGRGDSSSNAFDGHSQDMNYRAGYENYVSDII